MASLPAHEDSLFLPPLDKCFNDACQVISWKDAFEAITDNALLHDSQNLEQFFRDSRVINALASPSSVFASPTSQSYADFENRTAAINVTPTKNATLDTEQIKTDALWLSKLANIDEVSALRLAVLEWQARPAARLLKGYTEEEIISLNQAFGSLQFTNSFPAPALPTNFDHDSSKFEAEDSRRSRQLCLLLSEQEFLLQTNLALRVATGLQSTPVPRGRIYDISTPATAFPWMNQVMAEVKSSYAKSSNVDVANISSDFIVNQIQLLQKALQSWESGTNWSSFEDCPAFDQFFRVSCLRQALLHLNLIFTEITTIDHSPTALAVQTWFEFVDKFGFLELLHPNSIDEVPLVEKIQALVSLVSVQILRFPFTITYLSHPSAGDRPPPIIHDIACRSQIDHTLRQAAQRLSRIASPALFAWCMILQTLCNNVELAHDGSGSLSDEDSSLAEFALSGDARQALSALPKAFLEARDAIVQNSEQGSDPVEFYAHTAVEACDVFGVLRILTQTLGADCGSTLGPSFEFSVRLCLLELVREAVVFIGYKPEVFECVLEILGASDLPEEVTITSTRQLSPRVDLANVFMHDDEILVPRLLHQAYLRYPYEITPLLRLCKALVRNSAPGAGQQSIAQPLCEPSPYFTHVLPRAFDGYELVREDENANGVRLTQELPVIINRTWRKTVSLRRASKTVDLAEDLSEKDRGEFYIPQGTTGIVISDSKPFVVAWDHLHLPLRYLACLLSTASATSNRQDVSSEQALSKESQADIVSTLAKLIIADQQTISAASSQDQSSARAILEEFSDLLDRNQDVISVVSQLLEQELSRLDELNNSSSFTLLSSCLEFYAGTLKVLPGRIWPLLARTQLLDIDGNASLLNAIIAAENNTGSCSFFKACIDLLDALRHDVIAQAVSSRSELQTSSKRFQQATAVAPNIPKKVMGKIFLAFSRAICDSLQALQTWQQVQVDAKLNLITRTIRVFNDILYDVYAHDDTVEPPERFCGALAPAAKLIFDTVTAKYNSLITGLILFVSKSTLTSASNISGQIPTPDSSTSIRVCLKFLTTILEVCQLLNLSTCHLENQLLRCMPLFVRLFAAYNLHRSSISLLFSLLVRRLCATNSKPPSLLGSLGISNSLAFLMLLANLGKPLENSQQEVQAWNLASSVVSNRQQWFAAFLMTGDNPQKSLRHKKCKEDSPKTMSIVVLDVALDKMSTVETFHQSATLACVNFVLQAQNSWPWVSINIRKRSNLVEKLINYVDDLSTNLSRAELDEPNQTYAASLIAEIIATYIHNMRQIGDSTPVKLVSPKLAFYRDNAVALPTYNSSLHSNLKRNFEQKFQGCSLQRFKKSFGSLEFGRNYCYDVHFAGQVLGYHQSWKGTKNQGFEMELARANTNLSLVESQILLFSGWKSLCVELCYSLTGNENLQKQMIHVANNCLLSNIASTLPEPIFDHLLQARAELALAILQRLINAQVVEAGVQRLLITTWDAVVASGQDFEVSFSGDNSTYYRTLIQTIFLALQPYTYLGFSASSKSATTHGSDASVQPNKDFRDQAVSVIIEITSKVIGLGFRSLCSQLHQDGPSPDVSDFRLLTGLLRTIFSVEGIKSHYPQLALRLCDSAAHRYAITLFSWADRLAGEDDDPIYGDLSISFLRELSGIPPMAEFLAAEGILSQLSSAPIMTRLAESSSGRLQEIWSFGVLPLVLNLLVTIGDSFVAESTAFLNSFPVQLNRASSSLSLKTSPSKMNPLAGVMTLAAAAELHSLTIISVALDKYRDCPASSAATASGYATKLDWDRAVIREDIEGWLQGSRAQLKAKIVASDAREAQMQALPPLGKTKGGEDGCDNRLEESIVLELNGALNYLGGSE